MELRHLFSFVCVADTLSFSAAAIRCNITQSAVSQHIKMLESEMKCRLLIRTSHKIALTESGEALLLRAREILRQAADCKEHIHALNNCMTGELRIGVGSFIAPYVRHAAIVFMERYPGVRLNAEFTKACRLNDLLRSHTLDLAFTMNTSYPHEGIESFSCIPFHVFALMQRSHALAKKSAITYDDLLKHAVIMPDVGDRVFETFQRYVPYDLTKLNVKCIVGDPDEALAVAERTRYITFMPKLYLQHHPSLVSRPIVGLDRQLMSNAHWMKDVPMKRSAQIFLDIIREESIPYLSALEETT